MLRAPVYNVRLSLVSSRGGELRSAFRKREWSHISPYENHPRVQDTGCYPVFFPSPDGQIALTSKALSVWYGCHRVYHLAFDLEPRKHEEILGKVIWNQFQKKWKKASSLVMGVSNKYFLEYAFPLFFPSKVSLLPHLYFGKPDWVSISRLYLGRMSWQCVTAQGLWGGT